MGRRGRGRRKKMEGGRSGREQRGRGEGRVGREGEIGGRED